MKLFPNKETDWFWLTILSYLVMYILFLIILLGNRPSNLSFDKTGITHNIKTYEKKAITTAYTLSVEETDSTPFFGAWGDDLRNLDFCVVATRLYSRGTIIHIEGFKQGCKVMDKTSKRYGSRIDILFPTKKEALEFGIREMKYRVIK